MAPTVREGPPSVWGRKVDRSYMRQEVFHYFFIFIFRRKEERFCVRLSLGLVDCGSCLSINGVLTDMRMGGKQASPLDWERRGKMSIESKIDICELLSILGNQKLSTKSSSH